MSSLAASSTCMYDIKFTAGSDQAPESDGSTCEAAADLCCRVVVAVCVVAAIFIVDKLDICSRSLQLCKHALIDEPTIQLCKLVDDLSRQGRQAQ